LQFLTKWSNAVKESASIYSFKLSSKKKYVWRFRIGDTTYDLQFISSALSGKRIVSLNDKPIFSEQK
jgi:hypothetical protein